jgi:adenylyltransferase/sulfurtransferase
VLLGKPYVWGSIYRFDGQASVFWAEHGPCYRCLYPEPPPPGMVPSCAEGGGLGVLCASIGSIQATEAIKVLTGVGDSLVGRLMVYDALEMSYRTIKVRKDPDCPLCGKKPVDHHAHRLRGRSAAPSPRRPPRPSRARRSAAKDLAAMLDAARPSSSSTSRAERVRDRLHPGATLSPRASSFPGAAWRSCRRTADRAALQEGARRPRPWRGQECRLLRRGARRRRRAGLGQPGRSLAARLKPL